MTPWVWLCLLGLLVAVLTAFSMGWALSAWWNVRRERRRWWTWMKSTFCIRDDENPDWF